MADSYKSKTWRELLWIPIAITVVVNLANFMLPILYSWRDKPCHAFQNDLLGSINPNTTFRRQIKVATRTNMTLISMHTKGHIKGALQ
jgi:hypothetical protein